MVGFVTVRPVIVTRYPPVVEEVVTAFVGLLVLLAVEHVFGIMEVPAAPPESGVELAPPDTPLVPTVQVVVDPEVLPEVVGVGDGNVAFAPAGGGGKVVVVVVVVVAGCATRGPDAIAPGDAGTCTEVVGVAVDAVAGTLNEGAVVDVGIALPDAGADV